MVYRTRQSVEHFLSRATFPENSKPSRLRNLRDVLPIAGAGGERPCQTARFDFLMFFCDYAAIRRPCTPIFCTIDIDTIRFVISKMFSRNNVFICVKLDYKKWPLFPLSRCEYIRYGNGCNAITRRTFYAFEWYIAHDNRLSSFWVVQLFLKIPNRAVCAT